MGNSSANNQEPKNCWEYWGCSQESKKTCKACKAKAGKKCWYFAEGSRPVIDRGFDSCGDCPWFKQLQS